MQDYPDFYVGDTKQGKVFKITDVKLTNQCSGRLQKLYPAASTNSRVVSVALVFHKDRLYIAVERKSKCGFCGCVALSAPSNYSFALTSMSFRDLPLL